MMFRTFLSRHRLRWIALRAGLIVMVAILAVAQTSQAQEGGEEPPRPAAPDFSHAAIIADRDQAKPGDVLQYSIVMSNQSGGPADEVVITSELPAGLSYVPESLTANAGEVGEAGGVITWRGPVRAGDEIVVTFKARLSPELAPGTRVTNTAVISGGGESAALATRTTIIGGTVLAYLPYMEAPLPDLVLSATRPNSNNEWVLSWPESPLPVAGYELQESQDPDFTTATTYDTSQTSVTIEHAPSINNVYYYRARALSSGSQGEWSNVVRVVGAYFDDFSNVNSGWATRRTTFLEEVRTFYEEGYLVIQVEDSWDWGIFSPLQPAPEPPYAIEFDSKIAHFGNLVSHGVVFGGDWNGLPCPDYSSLDGVYEHQNCFNHFYNMNVIWYGPFKMLFERVDYLVWCPECGGSPMKRLSNDYGTWFTKDPIPVSQDDIDDYNEWRVEVRPTGIKMFVNDQLYAESSDTTWINDPYFGLFASTDEYSNSTWRVDNFSVTPLDQ